MTSWQEKWTASLKKRKQAALNGEWYFKASSADIGTKINLILANQGKYPISAMCRILGVTRSLVYYKHKRNQEEETALEKVVIRIFRESRNNYGTRKIKYKLEKENIILSRRKIGTIMKKYGLVSNYTVKQYKVYI